VLFCNIWFYFRHWRKFSAASFAWRSCGMPISALIVPNCAVIYAFAVGSQNNVHNAPIVEHHCIFMNWSTVVGLKRWHSSWIPCRQLGLQTLVLMTVIEIGRIHLVETCYSIFFWGWSLMFFNNVCSFCV